MCVCVWEREREREREKITENCAVYLTQIDIYWAYTHTNTLYRDVSECADRQTDKFNVWSVNR